MLPRRRLCIHVTRAAEGPGASALMTKDYIPSLQTTCGILIHHHAVPVVLEGAGGPRSPSPRVMFSAGATRA